MVYMTVDDQIRQRFERVLAEFGKIERKKGLYGLPYYDTQEASIWLAKADAALSDVFPESHATRKRFSEVGHPPTGKREDTNAFLSSVGIFTAAVELVRDGQHRPVLEAVRAETVIELLDQADALVAAHHVVPATVIAGGALETHLLHLCNSHGLTWTGSGSISKYDGAIASARKNGTVSVYSLTDSKQVTAWGGMRNDAAHSPGNYSKTEPEVRMMIEGIRQFVARTA